MKTENEILIEFHELNLFLEAQKTNIAKIIDEYKVLQSEIVEHAPSESQIAKILSIKDRVDHALQPFSNKMLGNTQENAALIYNNPDSYPGIPLNLLNSYVEHVLPEIMLLTLDATYHILTTKDFLIVFPPSKQITETQIEDNRSQLMMQINYFKDISQMIDNTSIQQMNELIFRMLPSLAAAPARVSSLSIFTLQEEQVINNTQAAQSCCVIS